MGTGWRKAFCTSVRKDTSETTTTPKQQTASPRTYSRLKLFSSSSSSASSFSNPSTPRTQVQSDVVSPSPTLRCRTTRSVGMEEGSGTAKLQSGSGGSPMASPRVMAVAQSPALSNPCSPRSPSRFALLRNSLRLSRSRCGICLQSVKAVQGTAIFIAECSHSFHFPCIATQVRKQGALVCPVCSSTWRHVPLLSVGEQAREEDDDGSSGVCGGDTREWRVAVKQESGREMPVSVSPKSSSETTAVVATQPVTVKGYSDDEPLLSPGGGASRFIPIPEENDEDEEGEKKCSGDEFQGFFATTPADTSTDTPRRRQPTQQQITSPSSDAVQITVDSDVALLSNGRNHDKYVVALKVKALSLSPSCRAPIDLVIVVDVGGIMTGAKFQMLKRSIKQLISSLTSADRLSLVAFAATAKRLLPLRRMTPQGQRSTRRVIDRLVSGQVATSAVGDALRKATRILEDRRERNPVASIMLLADGQQQHQSSEKGDLLSLRRPSFSSSSISARFSSTTSSAGTRFAHIEIPVSEDPVTELEQEPAEEAFARCVGGLLSVVVHDVKLQLNLPSCEITAVYSISGQPTADVCVGGMVKLGDLYGDEERVLLVEIRISTGLRQISMNATYNFRVPATQDTDARGEEHLLVTLPPPAPTAHHRHKKLSTLAPKAERLRNLFVTTRAITEARRLTGLNDTGTALHLLSSARSLLLQSTSISAEENLRAVEVELAELQRRRQQRRRRECEREAVVPVSSTPDNGGGEALTPTSAWRAAERLAKLAIMRKSLNRVSDLHGFEDARF